MSFYIEIENYQETDTLETPTTFLVSSFYAASRFEQGKGYFSKGANKIDPSSVVVTTEIPGPLVEKGYFGSRTEIKLPVSYQEFKNILVESEKNHSIPSFKI